MLVSTFLNWRRQRWRESATAPRGRHGAATRAYERPFSFFLAPSTTEPQGSEKRQPAPTYLSLLLHRHSVGSGLRLPPGLPETELHCSACRRWISTRLEITFHLAWNLKSYSRNGSVALCRVPSRFFCFGAKFRSILLLLLQFGYVTRRTFPRLRNEKGAN